MMLGRLLIAMLLAVGMTISGPVSAQTFPTKPITLVVPYPPGGGTDAIARIVQESMSKFLGQQIVVENVGGAGGTIAAARVARAAADGHTIMIHQVALAASKALYKNLAFDPEKDFATIGLINIGATLWVGRGDLPPNTLPELVSWMKEPGQNAKIAHPGVGSFGHLAGVLVAQELGAAVTQVPYRGGGPALNDLLGGRVDLSSQTAVQSAPHVKAGKLKAYASLGSFRFAGLPDLPTMRELGYKNLDLNYWHMLVAPAGTPAPAIERLNAALGAALEDPAADKLFVAGGMVSFPPEQRTPEAAAAYLKEEIKRWGDVIRANKIAVEQ
jgi:tripartite-type tricarboxylate transporter receptor subunit TctC